MDYAKIAEEVIKYVGGKSNIRSVTHCATRLRLQLKDNCLRNEEALSDVEGVKGVFLSQTQFQIIFGSGTVNMVCDEVQKQLGSLDESQPEAETEEKKGNVLQQFVKMLSDIFVPIIPAIVAGGLLMGLYNVLTSNLIHGQSIISLYPQWEGLATAINLFSSAPFTFLPVLIGFSAAKQFGHGHDHGSSRPDECVSDRRGRTSRVEYFWTSHCSHRLSGNGSSRAGCVLDSGQY